jgi:hypothetical protein
MYQTLKSLHPSEIRTRLLEETMTTTYTTLPKVNPTM